VGHSQFYGLLLYQSAVSLADFAVTALYRKAFWNCRKGLRGLRQFVGDLLVEDVFYSDGMNNFSSFL
jgi:hypothetical protein